SINNRLFVGGRSAYCQPRESGMKAAVVNEINGRFDVEEISIDGPVGREVLVEVKAAGLCHSDLLVASIDRGRPLPMVVGHEMSGVVAAVGPDVRHLGVGDHVV